MSTDSLLFSLGVGGEGVCRCIQDGCPQERSKKKADIIWVTEKNKDY